MDVKLIAHTQLSEEFVHQLKGALLENYVQSNYNDRQVVALTAIRTCYSPGKPARIAIEEGPKYFGQAATDGGSGTDADRLFRHITRSGHTSTLEHISYTFAVEGVSRALLAQLTRHRVGFSYSVQSQRYVRFGSEDKSGGFDYVVPPSVTARDELLDQIAAGNVTGSSEEKRGKALTIYHEALTSAQKAYDDLRAAGVPAEDARMVLPNAAACNLVLTVNLRALLNFYRKRRPGKGAQWEIADLAVKLREAVVAVDPWTSAYFDN
ncbi:FAD-dependent thymidylate synthase [Paenibacillus sp. 1P03SA]|uniref:FAD-dependent thymidylate synthase n=1 Tax=Paenibacillus sp. 1P03SA TaxID=3132294 RepID=UPI0039A32760